MTASSSGPAEVCGCRSAHGGRPRHRKSRGPAGRSGRAACSAPRRRTGGRPSPSPSWCRTSIGLSRAKILSSWLRFISTCTVQMVAPMAHDAEIAERDARWSCWHSSATRWLAPMPRLYRHAAIRPAACMQLAIGDGAPVVGADDPRLGRMALRRPRDPVPQQFRTWLDRHGANRVDGDLLSNISNPGRGSRTPAGTLHRGIRSAQRLQVSPQAVHAVPRQQAVDLGMRAPPDRDGACEQRPSRRSA